MKGVVAALAVALVAPTTAVAGDDDPLYQVRVVFARDQSLWRTDGKGKGPPEEVATLPSAATDVRSLRTDAAGKVLLADIAGTWHWLPLDGSTKSLTALACKGAATLAPDGSCAICAGDTGKVSIIHLATGKTFAVAVPAAGAAIVGATDKVRRLIWSDGGIWSAPPGKLKAKQAVAPESPLRSLAVAPDGSRAVGVYAGEIHDGRKTTAPAELLYEFALDGTAARRQTIRSGVPVMWSHDSQWILIQDGSSACVARGVGGQYKCWKGYTAVSIAPDGSYALVLGQRKGDKAKGDKGDKADKQSGASAEGEAGDDDTGADTAVPLPTGPLSLYRAELAGAYTDPPALLERIVDGAAVWLP